MPTTDYKLHRVRPSAVLTDAYVAGNIIGVDIDVESNLERKNELILLFDFTIGSLTSAELKVEFAHELQKSLAYDGQTANFAVGEIVTGTVSKAQGTVVKDTDAGATGTLVLRNVIGQFQDNEAITGNVAGVAVVNGSLSDTTIWHQETAQALTAGLSTLSLVEHQVTATGKYRLPIEVMDRYIKVSAKGTGTATGSLLTVLAATGSIAT